MQLAKPADSADIDPTHRDAEQLLKIRQLANSPHNSSATPTDIATPIVAAKTASHSVKSAPPPETKTAAASPASAEVAPAKPKKKQENTDKQIRAVAVPVVKGAPGRGNVELTAAMREVLKTAGWPVRSAPADDALTIRGKVEVGKNTNGQQKVTLAWELVDPDGSVIGTIRQANTVPAGAVDAGFGPNAHYAAQAAASGIFNLIAKVKKRQG
ncbi:MAG: hypothetical protein ACR2OR_07945 [Hyphomicrobiales bacterium]